MKIENDKYYTPIAVANKCWDNDWKGYLNCIAMKKNGRLNVLIANIKYVIQARM